MPFARLVSFHGLVACAYNNHFPRGEFTPGISYIPPGTEIDNAFEIMDYSTITMTLPAAGIKHGRRDRAAVFQNERLVVVHPPQVIKASRSMLLRSFCPTDIGLFLTASLHERRRLRGAKQTIFIHCIRGNGWCEMEGTRYPVKQGDLLIIPARCPHVYGSSKDHPWSIEWFHAVGDGIPDLVRRLGAERKSPVLEIPRSHWDSSLFEEALSSLEAGFTDAHLLYAAFALQHLLSRLIIQGNRNSEDRSSVQARMEKTIRYMREYYAKAINVNELAVMAGFSASHFAVLFHKFTGHSPADYLIRTRIEAACRLLDFSRLSIKEIAAKVGYDDPYYFSRIFKKTTSYSPKTYRFTNNVKGG